LLGKIFLKNPNPEPRTLLWTFLPCRRTSVPIGQNY
jgi:hypothetical protein